VALRRADAHALWVNRAALSLAGITADTPDPAGGVIVRDGRGAPTGLLIDAAADLVTCLIPPPSAQALQEMVVEEAEVMLSQGVTCVHEMATDARLLAALQNLDARQRLALRVRSFLWAADPTWAADPDAAAVVAAGPDPRPVLGVACASMLRRVGLKLFADGALGSRGARLSRPYPGGGVGVQPDSPALFADTLWLARRAGWQVAVHAIGDAAVGEVVSMLAAHQPGGGRWRVEHVQIAPDAALAQMARAGLCAAAQPLHAAHDLPWAAPLLGPHLTAIAYPWRRLWALSIPTGLGSDYPIESASVLAGLFAATQRADARAPTVTLPGSAERLTRAQALHGYTAGAAALTFDEAALGALGPGRACDLCVWDRDLTACPPSDLLGAKLLAVVINGVRVR
jgi:predicted amidohydrolase YtcJ